MVMSWIWTGIAGISILCALSGGSGGNLAAAILQGAQAGVTLGISITGMLAALLKPLLGRIFPSTEKDPILSQRLSANICANILGLGNAATPMGIQAAKRLKHGDTATDELCRLIVLNTASIQLIPSNVAAVRAALGCRTPFDILPAVWVTSLLSAGLGVTAAWLLGKVWKK